MAVHLLSELHVWVLHAFTAVYSCMPALHQICKNKVCNIQHQRSKEQMLYQEITLATHRTYQYSLLSKSSVIVIITIIIIV